MKWKYKGRQFESVPYDFDRIEFTLASSAWKELLIHNGAAHQYIGNNRYPLVYHTKWNKCYILIRTTYGGHDKHKLKAILRDVYTCRELFAAASDLELVTEMNDLEFKKCINIVNDFKFLVITIFIVTLIASFMVLALHYPLIVLKIEMFILFLMSLYFILTGTYEFIKSAIKHINI